MLDPVDDGRPVGDEPCDFLVDAIHLLVEVRSQIIMPWSLDQKVLRIQIWNHRGLQPS